jgi:hypothetical protein
LILKGKKNFFAKRKEVIDIDSIRNRNQADRHRPFVKEGRGFRTAGGKPDSNSGGGLAAALPEPNNYFPSIDVSAENSIPWQSGL